MLNIFFHLEKKNNKNIFFVSLEVDIMTLTERKKIGLYWSI